MLLFIVFLMLFTVGNFAYSVSLGDKRIGIDKFDKKVHEELAEETNASEGIFEFQGHDYSKSGIGHVNIETPVYPQSGIQVMKRSSPPMPPINIKVK